MSTIYFFPDDHTVECSNKIVSYCIKHKIHKVGIESSQNTSKSYEDKDLFNLMVKIYESFNPLKINTAKAFIEVLNKHKIRFFKFDIPPFAHSFSSDLNSYSTILHYLLVFAHDCNLPSRLDILDAIVNNKTMALKFKTLGEKLKSLLKDEMVISVLKKRYKSLVKLIKEREEHETKFLKLKMFNMERVFHEIEFMQDVGDNLSKLFYKHALYERNNYIAKKLIKLCKTKDLYLIIGAWHLRGNNSLTQILKNNKIKYKLIKF